jgi:TldD protein
MIKDIDLGVLHRCLRQPDRYGDSSAGYMIRNGQWKLVRDVLTGNVFETLMNIDRIGNKLEWHPNGPGGCGKGDQAPLRVGLGGPYVRIQNCVIGGQQ